MLSRREVIRLAGQGYAGAKIAPFVSAINLTRSSIRCVNVINFIRAVEPRLEMDLMLPVRKQMELVRKHALPATWLLQFDALVSGPFVQFLKDEITPHHEVGLWFEMNERHCRAASVEWRGRPGYEWDYMPSVAFSIGYSKDDRVKLADTAMEAFKRIFGGQPVSVASWNLDAFTMQHLNERYGIDAFAVCRDQIATDGFTIWGAPIAGYYPSKTNCWSPALDRHNQIAAPVFRMLGQDPVYYYDRTWRMPGRKALDTPDTMEPVWPSGQDPTFVRNFLGMIEDGPSLGFAYAQLGQENSFPWDQQAPGYPLQMEALAELRDRGVVNIETLGATGRRFKRAFKQTPAQSQVMLEDPFGNTAPACGSIWYQSRFYRANLHLRGEMPYLRDLTVYGDRFEQPFLNQPARTNFVEQRMPAVVDGHHWKAADHEAGIFLEVGGERAQLSGRLDLRESGSSIEARLSIQGSRELHLRFNERRLSVESNPPAPLALVLECDRAKSSLAGVMANRAVYRWQGFDFSLAFEFGRVEETPTGWTVRSPTGRIDMRLAQPTA